MNKKGFTLIELLVVVLIIGVLTAIVAPRYHLFVARAKIMEMVTLGARMHEAEQEYRLVNGLYTMDLSLLNVEGFSCAPQGSEVSCNYGKFTVRTGTSDLSSGYWMKIFFKNIPTNKFPQIETYGDKRFECLTDGYEANNDICAMFGGRTRSTNNTYYYMDNL